MSTQAILFIVGFLVVLFAYIGLMVYIVKRLDNTIDRGRYQLIERLAIGGIVLGVVGMFQPWLFIAYKYGFLLVFVSTLTFIIWNHVTPKGVQRSGEMHSVTLGDAEGES